VNLASWIVLGIVIVAVGFAIKATFFKKKSKGGCCDLGDEPMKCPASGCSGCSCTSCNEMQARYKVVVKDGKTE